MMRSNTSPAGDVPLVLTFRDKPGRNFPARNDPVQEITWVAHLYIADWTEATKTVTLHDGIAWGFTIKCEGTTNDQTVYRSGGAAARMPSRNRPDNVGTYKVPASRMFSLAP